MKQVTKNKSFNNLKDSMKYLLNASLVLPEPFRKIANASNQINKEIEVSFKRLEKRVGHIEANELKVRFENEAFAGKELNHKHMILMMDSYKK